MKISVFGTGYVGLVASVCFGDVGHHVIGADIDENKIRQLKDGICPIYEPGLEELLRTVLHNGHISFTTDLEWAVAQSDMIFIAVGTPEGEDGSADLQYVLACAKLIAETMTSEKTVVLKSTVPVGTAEKVEELMGRITKIPFEVVNNPEFLKEGTSLDDFQRPDRIVIGCRSEKGRQLMAELYAPFVKNGHPILFMSNKAAELTKYAANSFLATKISFINELARLADTVGADIEEIKRGFTSDKRISPAFFYPGVGYGGSCFPKDVKALIKAGHLAGVPMELIQATDRVNDKQKLVLVEKLRAHFGNLSGLKFGLWGLSFKPRTDDVREAPAFAIIDMLLEQRAQVVAYDPAALENAKKRYEHRVHWAQSAMEACDGCDALVVATEWNEFRSPDFDEIKRRLKKPVVFDGRNVFEPEMMKRKDFTYFCIGRQGVCAP